VGLTRPAQELSVESGLDTAANTTCFWEALYRLRDVWSCGATCGMIAPQALGAWSGTT